MRSPPWVCPKIRPPGGDAGFRTWSPFLQTNVVGSHPALVFLLLTNKITISLDLRGRYGNLQLLPLNGTLDFLVEANLAPASAQRSVQLSLSV